MPDDRPRGSAPARVRKRAGEPVRHRVNQLPFEVWKAIGFVQAQYGVSDKLIAKVAQCGQSTVVEKRAKYGWVVRKLPKNFDDVSSKSVTDDASRSESQPNDDAPVDDMAIKRLTEKLMLKISSEVAASDADDFDHMALKRLEILSGAVKSIERLAEARSGMRPMGNPLYAPASAEETAAVLKKIGVRIEDLAERKANERAGKQRTAGAL